jgi:hypothetical protein
MPQANTSTVSGSAIIRSAAFRAGVNDARSGVPRASTIFPMTGFMSGADSSRSSHRCLNHSWKGAAFTAGRCTTSAADSPAESSSIH